mmetsp:Transcript_19291/g.35463  ORF Transcript_19291/g.35463 Transcript_19291/m.35463 type:complete len:191 (-) Transcript_19291:5563-6135(-)
MCSSLSSMFFDNDISRDFNLDCGLESMPEGRDRVNSFVFILSGDNEDELPDLNSDLPLDDVCRYLQQTSYSYSSDPSTSTNLDDVMDEAIAYSSISVPSKVKRCELRPQAHYYYLSAPQPAKQIGNLTPEERYNKIKRYKEKRERRVWSKKINYGCRKRVADNRLRIKGRFVTKEQAKALSSCADPNSSA